MTTTREKRIKIKATRTKKGKIKDWGMNRVSWAQGKCFEIWRNKTYIEGPIIVRYLFSIIFSPVFEASNKNWAYSETGSWTKLGFDGASVCLKEDENEVVPEGETSCWGCRPYPGRGICVPLWHHKEEHPSRVSVFWHLLLEKQQNEQRKQRVMFFSLTRWRHIIARKHRWFYTSGVL